jgi:hypothetical protein
MQSVSTVLPVLQTIEKARWSNSIREILLSSFLVFLPSLPSSPSLPPLSPFLPSLPSLPSFLAFFFPSDRVSLYSSNLPGIPYAADAGLELVILLPQPPECWNYRRELPSPASFKLFFFLSGTGV